MFKRQHMTFCNNETVTAFYLFDPHARNINGLPHELGTNILLGWGFFCKFTSYLFFLKKIICSLVFFTPWKIQFNLQHVMLNTLKWIYCKELYANISCIFCATNRMIQTIKNNKKEKKRYLDWSVLHFCWETIKGIFL